MLWYIIAFFLYFFLINDVLQLVFAIYAFFAMRNRSGNETRLILLKFGDAIISVAFVSVMLYFLHFNIWDVWSVAVANSLFAIFFSYPQLYLRKKIRDSESRLLP